MYCNLFNVSLNNLIFDRITLQYIVTRNHQVHVLVAVKLKNVACIRADTNYAQCINSAQINGIMRT